MRACLEDVPSVKIKGLETERDFKGYRADLVTTVTTPTGTTCFLVAEIKATGEPRVAREALNQLWRNWANQPDVVPVFIAPYISPNFYRAGGETQSVLGKARPSIFVLPQEWIRKVEKGLVLREPEKLLTEWSENYSFRKNTTRDFFSLKAVVDLETDLAKVCVENKGRYALTGFSASARLAPAVRSPRAQRGHKRRQRDSLGTLRRGSILRDERD